MQLADKNALVTGGGRGIGQGIALALAGAGANVAIADRDLAIAIETATKVEELGRRSLALKADVADPDSVATMIARTEKTIGGLDIAVNNAGILSIYPVEEVTAAEWDRIMAVNARGVFLCTQAEIRVMRPRRSGRIVNVASVAGKIGFPGIAHYSASKFAVVGLTNAVAKEVATEGITVNAICPGIIGTAMWRGDEGLAGRWRKADETEEASWLRHLETLLPQGVAQTPADIGGAAVYLAGAAHVTGQAIAVDGGFSL